MPRSPSRLKLIRWLAFLLIALAGLALRLPRLGGRPMHTDEAVNAYIVGELLSGQAFTYDPHDRHGPALAALAFPLARMQGAKTFAALTESELRLTSVLAGTFTILLFGVAADIFGLLPCILAAALFACASLPVYYDRYFIHESLFVAATFAFILCAWHALKTNSAGQAALAGACAALMLACKETAVLHFFALGVPVVALLAFKPRGVSLGPRLRWRAVLAGFITFLLLGTALFTWFGRNWRALPAMTQAIHQEISRAGGQGHERPFWYYAQLLTGGWSGGLLFALACIGLVVTLRKHDVLYGLLGGYAPLIAVIYSLIPYKTPWLALNLFLPMALFAGHGLASLWSMLSARLSRPAVVGVLLLPGTLALLLIAHDTRGRVFLHASDETNPYAYAHTSEDLLGLPAELEDIARRDGINAPRIAVIASDPWPLPWYLRRFSQVGFWQPGQAVGAADFYITSTEAADQYADRLRNFRPDFFGLRPGVLILLWLPAPK